MRSALILLLVACACAPRTAQVAGRVVVDGQPLAGARVTLRGAGGDLEVRATSGADGVYRMPAVPPGEYSLDAWAEGPPRLGALPGRNPLHLAAGSELWLGLQATRYEEPTAQPLPEAAPGMGAVRGRVLHGGTPVAGAVVDLHLDATGGMRGLGVRRSPPTGSDGVYTVDEVPEAQYHVVARRRSDASVAGPIREGDLHGVALASPVAVRAGSETILDVHVVRKERSDDPNEDLLALRRTGIRGRIVDPAGAPVQGAYVFAYRDRVVGHRKPDFLTLPTGADGVFALPLGEGGLFYVGARERSGGSPIPGERFGFYEGSPDHGILVSPGRVVEGVEIVVRKVLE